MTYLFVEIPITGKVMKQSANDQILLIGAGVTLHEAVTAAEELAASGIGARVIDPFTIKPIDVNLILTHAKKVGGKIITIEDHYPEGECCLLVKRN